MTSFLVIYDTGEGQTAKVAARIDSVLTERGHDVTRRHVSNVPTETLEAFDAVLVGSPLIYQRHLPAVIEFVERNRELLAARPSAFFQVSFASAVPSRWAQGGAVESVEAMIERTGWHPDRVGRFAGAVTYTRYDRATKLLFQLTSLFTTGDTDTSRDYEYTDWDAVERFAVEFDEYVQSRRTLPSLAPVRRVVPDAGRGRVALLGAGLVGAAFWLLRRRQATRSDPERGIDVPIEDPVEPMPP